MLVVREGSLKKQKKVGKFQLGGGWGRMGEFHRIFFQLSGGRGIKNLKFFLMTPSLLVKIQTININSTIGETISIDSEIGINQIYYL